MSEDLYSTLGVSKNADASKIKHVYRKLAAKLHPDKNPGDKAIEERFKKINRAYQVLSDPKKRKLYDEFGDVSLSEGFDADRARAYKQWGGGMPGGGMPGGGMHFNIEDLFGGAAGAGQPGAGGLGDLFGDLFGGGARRGRGRQRPARQSKGADVNADLNIDFRSAVTGTTMSLRLDGQSEEVKVRIPPGASEGKRLRVPGKGQPSPFGGPNGDLWLKIHVEPHSHFRMDGPDLHLDLPITVSEAYFGAKVRVPTPTGDVTMQVPALAQSGQVMRLRGKGIKRKNKPSGDLYVHFQVHVPTSDSDEVRRAMDALGQAQASSDLRHDLKL